MRLLCLLLPLLVSARASAEDPEVRLPAGTVNLLTTAEVSSNLASFDAGLRGEPDHLLWDSTERTFVKPSPWHEYGVGFGADLGVVPEGKPAWWQAAWSEPVAANLIVLTGVYPNQPQPETAWKIELRREGRWTEHARGVGGWYNTGRYVWGGVGTEPVRFDAFRVSVFSKDEKTPLKSIHFRGEAELSWVVALAPPFEAALALPQNQVRATREATFEGRALAGKIASWRWDFGDGATADGKTVRHTFAEPGTYQVRLTVSEGQHAATLSRTVEVESPIEVSLVPLTAPVFTAQAVTLDAVARLGKVNRWTWDFGDGTTGEGAGAAHTFAEPGRYRVQVQGTDGKYTDECFALIRVHTPATLRVPQVVLDTDQKNEQDDQHYFGYGLFSELDVLGVNSVHHGGGQEPMNYGELVHVLDLAKQSGLRPDREPFLFHGANQRLTVPASSRWEDTAPLKTEASEAILAAARGASPTNPVWVVPVGPGTNVASAILQARAEGLDLRGRLRVMWLGGSNGGISGEFNGNNDPWSMYVVAQSGLETWIMPAPVGARVTIDKRTEGDLYADHPLGQYLKKIVPARRKPLFDPSCLSAIISLRLDLGWIKQTEYVTVGGPDSNYRWTKSETPTAVRIIREIDQAAMRADIFETMKGKATQLVCAP